VNRGLAESVLNDGCSVFDYADRSLSCSVDSSGCNGTTLSTTAGSIVVNVKRKWMLEVDIELSTCPDTEATDEATTSYSGSGDNEQCNSTTDVRLSQLKCKSDGSRRRLSNESSTEAAAFPATLNIEFTLDIGSIDLMTLDTPVLSADATISLDAAIASYADALNTTTVSVPDITLEQPSLSTFEIDFSFSSGDEAGSSLQDVVQNAVDGMETMMSTTTIHLTTSTTVTTVTSESPGANIQLAQSPAVIGGIGVGAAVALIVVVIVVVVVIKSSRKRIKILARTQTVNSNSKSGDRAAQLSRVHPTGLVSTGPKHSVQHRRQGPPLADGDITDAPPSKVRSFLGNSKLFFMRRVAQKFRGSAQAPGPRAASSGQGLASRKPALRPSPPVAVDTFHEPDEDHVSWGPPIRLSSARRSPRPEAVAPRAAGDAVNLPFVHGVRVQTEGVIHEM